MAKPLCFVFVGVVFVAVVFGRSCCFVFHLFSAEKDWVNSFVASQFLFIFIIKIK